RLCFPTHGVVASGKTMWLIKSYFLIKSGNVPTPVALEQIESDQNTKIEAELKALQVLRQAPEATKFVEKELPYPLLFSFRDRDASAVLLNLFDFSGEMTQRRLDASPLRKRALQMDGVIIVLDPTWPSDKDPGRRNVEWQKDAFQRFINELRRV